jgi:DNA-binding MarR family transcriptional regulator
MPTKVKCGKKLRKYIFGRTSHKVCAKRTNRTLSGSGQNFSPNPFRIPKKAVHLFSCLTNCMPNNQFKRGELYSFITGKASTAIARNLQKKFNTAGLKITIEQWSVLYHLWKEDGKSQQELCSATFRDKPSITRLVDNLEKQQLVKRVPSEQDRRINLIYLTRQAQKLQEETMQLAEATLNEALEGVPADRIDVCKEVLQVVYDNLR